ncbi:MAG: helix-turn-helix domain-containing protein [Clostridiales bacterium]|nr:helix-turn-helix domain-containing protein [Clostridiales bacterium]
MRVALSEIWELTDCVEVSDKTASGLAGCGEIYEIVLMLVLKGRGRLQTAEGDCWLEPGDVAVRSRFLETGCVLDLTADPLQAKPWEQKNTAKSSDGYIAAVLHFPAAKLSGMSARDIVYIEDKVFERKSGRSDELKGLLGRSLKNALCLEICREHETQILPQIFAWLAGHCLFKEQLNPASREERAEVIRRYMHSRYNRRLSLKELAERMELSVPYLSKFIKENLGWSFHNYLDHIRLSYTMSELKNNDIFLASAALLGGFPNIMAFNRAFEREYHTTLADYKKQKRHEPDTARTDLELRTSVQELLENIQDKMDRALTSHTFCVKARAGSGQPYAKNWMKVLNLGYAEDLQKGSIREHILQLKKELGFLYGRVENIFSQRLLVDIHSPERFNFSRVDMILDFLIENGIIPFLNMSFSDKIIRKDINRLFMKEDIVKGFANDDQYRRLIAEFFSHCVRRYGVSAVEKWRIELRWIHKIGDAMDARWLDIFEILYRTVKKYSPGAQVGGFCFNINDNNEMLKFYLKRKKYVRPDFISVVCYPYHMPGTGGGSPLVKDMDYMERKLDELNFLMLQNGYDNGSLYITEWNISISNNNYFHDSCWKGAYILRTAAAGLEKAWCMAHWGSSDRTTEYFDSVQLLNGRNGLISRNSIRKPSFYAYDFLNRMGSRLIKKDKRYILTENGSGSYFIVCNYLNPIRESYYRQADECVGCTQITDLFEKSEMKLRLELMSVDCGKYQVEKFSVSPDFGSVMDEWLRLGHKIECTDMERSWLISVCVPRYSRKIVESYNGCIEIETELMANEIQFLQISPYRAALDATDVK